MTTTLLTIIAVLLAVRIVLQIRQGKRVFEKNYVTTDNVEYNFTICSNNPKKIVGEAMEFGKDGWELVTILSTNKNQYILIFTRKKIKNYYEE